jgi:hypothetical protein
MPEIGRPRQRVRGNPDTRPREEWGPGLRLATQQHDWGAEGNRSALVGPAQKNHRGRAEGAQLIPSASHFSFGQATIRTFPALPVISRAG